MATENKQVTPALPTTTSNKISKSHHLGFSLLGLMVLIVGMLAVYFWQHHKVNTLNAQVNNMQTVLIKDAKVSLDKLEAIQALPNIVVGSANSPTDLIAFLGADNTQCYKANENGYFKVIAQDNDQFAKMQYGCTAKDGVTPLGATPAYTLAKKTSGSWSLISPTNQWLSINGQDVPSCVMVNNNKVSRTVTPECWQGPALVSGSRSNKTRTVVPVTNP